MRILQAASEAAPFAKTGGLGDIAGSLPAALAAEGLEVTLVLPLYTCCRESGLPLVPTGREVRVPVGSETVAGRLWFSPATAGRVDTVLIECDRFYRRERLYGVGAQDYPDNPARFVFLSRATLEAAKTLNLRPDVVHVHDWQTALVPAYLKTLYAKDPVLGAAKSLLTIHNLGYQGLFPAADMALTGLPGDLFNWKQLEFWGHLNFLKGGIVFADALNTVSPNYAREIQTEAFGHGLDGALRDRRADLHGILNRIDDATWNPGTDPLIARNYSARDFSGKAACREALREEMGLEASDAPLAGIISRFADQIGRAHV